MPSRFTNRLALGLARVKADAAEAVTIYRDADTGTTTAILGRTAIDLRDVEGVETRDHVADLLIDAADYNFGSGATEPRTGDEYVLTLNGTSRRLECFTPDGFDEAWRYSDRERTRFRIHTREV